MAHPSAIGGGGTSGVPSAPPTALPTTTTTVGRRIAVFAGDVKIAHTVFALPFALLSAFLAAHSSSAGVPRVGQLALILACMVTARTVAMAVNRLLDARLDAANPRTARRAIPSGALSQRFYWLVTIVCAAGFVASADGFLAIYANPWPLRLCAPVLAFLCAYPLLKRFTRLCHYYLGAALALAPVCAWIAIAGTIAPPPFWMAGAVLCWTAGFDIIYACQDYASDVQCGVFSIPAKLGIGRALWVARLTHVVSAVMLVALGWSARPPLGPIYFTGTTIAIGLLIVEHRLVRADDLSKVGIAFFTVNGIISVLVGAMGIIDVFL